MRRGRAKPAASGVAAGSQGVGVIQAELTDEEWAKIEELAPRESEEGGVQAASPTAVQLFIAVSMDCFSMQARPQSALQRAEGMGGRMHTRLEI